MRFIALLLLLSGCVNIQAQEYRLNYDPSTIPELYNTTTVYLEQKMDNNYRRVSGGYRLHTNDAVLKGNRISYDPDVIQQAKGRIRFTVQMGSQQKELNLTVPYLQDLRFNLYTDSIKPILNYYVNVEGVYSSGRIYPLTENQVRITSDVGDMRGNEWIVTATCNFEKVRFTATSKFDSAISKSVTVFLKRVKDPRDEPGYEEVGTPQKRGR